MPEDQITKTFNKGQEVSDQYAALLGPGKGEDRIPDRIQQSFKLGQQTAADMAPIVTGRSTSSRKEEK